MIPRSSAMPRATSRMDWRRDVRPTVRRRVLLRRRERGNLPGVTRQPGPVRLAGIACLLLNACATSYAALHKATVLKPGAFEFGADVTGTLPVSLLAYEAAGTATVKSDLQASQKGQPINIQANSALKDALAVGALLADPPRPVSEFTVRYGLPFAADVGIRGNPEQVRLDFFVQLLTGEWHGVAGVGYMHKWYIDGPVGLASLTPAGYLQRDDGDVTVLVGRDWALASSTSGPRPCTPISTVPDWPNSCRHRSRRCGSMIISNRDMPRHGYPAGWQDCASGRRSFSSSWRSTS